jgi:hypothetical protein
MKTFLSLMFVLFLGSIFIFGGEYTQEEKDAVFIKYYTQDVFEDSNKHTELLKEQLKLNDATYSTSTYSIESKGLFNSKVKHSISFNENNIIIFTLKAHNKLNELIVDIQLMAKYTVKGNVLTLNELQGNETLVSSNKQIVILNNTEQQIIAFSYNTGNSLIFKKEY